MVKKNKRGGKNKTKQDSETLKLKEQPMKTTTYEWMKPLFNSFVWARLNKMHVQNLSVRSSAKDL